jgi:hypothetical protein
VIDWEIEWPKIQAAAHEYAVSPYFVAAIRHTENGAPGREFGVLSVSAPTYEDQLRVTCLTVSHRMRLFIPAPHDPLSGLFIQYFANCWAPVGVENDPDNLNVNWFTNCRASYQKFLKDGGPS